MSRRNDYLDNVLSRISAQDINLLFSVLYRMRVHRRPAMNIVGNDS
jgi:hypothetical protein